MLSLDIPLQKLFGCFKRLQLWATGDWQFHHDNVPAHASRLMQFFCETSNHPGDSAPLQPRFGTLQLPAFLKTKITFERERFQTVDEIQENMMGQLMVIRRIVWGPKVSTLKGTEVSLSYIQCFLYLVCYSINVSIFHITWLDAFWTDYMYAYIHTYTHICI